jgi:hypothetical protein
VLPNLHSRRRVGRWGKITLVVTAMLAATSADAATLFPQPLHFVRVISDPISRRTSTIDEFCEGNRIVSIIGTRTVVVDYEKQTITELDRAAGTFSISTFDEIAHAEATLRGESTTAKRNTEWNATSLGAFKWRFNAPATTIDVTTDVKVMLSREALDAVIGASYPSRRTAEHDALTRAADGDRAHAESSSTTQPSFALPVDEAMTLEVEGAHVTVHNAIVRVDNATAPRDALFIPPGAKRVPSTRVALPGMLEELDRLPAAPRRP